MSDTAMMMVKFREVKDLFYLPVGQDFELECFLRHHYLRYVVGSDKLIKLANAEDMEGKLYRIGFDKDVFIELEGINPEGEIDEHDA